MIYGGYLSFIYPERGGFSEILPEMMIFPEGAASVKTIFHGHIPRSVHIPRMRG